MEPSRPSSYQQTGSHNTDEHVPLRAFVLLLLRGRSVPMRFRLPKPLHGWRAFAGEVGVIVLGVLIALGGQQLIEDWQWNSEVKGFRQSVEHELGRNLGIYQSIMASRPCATRRLADLEHFLGDSRAGRQDRIARPIRRPFMQTSYFSVWDNKGAEVVEHLPLLLRTQYGELYDEFRNNERVRLNEREVWRGLAQFEQPEPLDHADRVRMRELLSRAEQLNEVAGPNYDYTRALARPLGIHPIRDEKVAHLSSDDRFCQPLLAW
jgi:hypothetical protein